MKLKFKILLGFAVLIAIFMLVIVYNVMIIYDTSDNVDTIVEKKFTTEKYINDSNMLIRQIHAEIWDAMLFDAGGRQKRIDTLNKQAVDFYNNIRLIKEHIPSDKDESLRKLKGFFQEYFLFGSRILKMKSIEEVKEKIDTVNKFKQNKNKLISILDETVAESKKGFETALVELKEKLAFATMLTFIFTALVIVLSPGLALGISNTLTKPINNVMEVIGEVEQDNLDVEVKVITTDEIGKLSTSFNSMIKQVKLSREKLKEQERLKSEMELAQKIQLSLLPDLYEMSFNDFDISAVMIPADEVGGDFYDFAFDQDNQLWFGIGDVSGHGITPGLIMMMTQTVFTAFHRTLRNEESSPRDVIISINDVLFSNVRKRLKEGHFMTLTIFKYLGNGQFMFAGAHLDILIHRAKTNEFEWVKTEGTWINLIKDITSATTDKTLTLEQDDTMFLYTDGVTEANKGDLLTNTELNLLEPEGLQEIIGKHIKKDVLTLKDGIIEDVVSWCNNIRADDMTLVIFRKK